MYEALKLEKSVASLAFSPQTPFSLANRVVQGRFQDLSKALQRSFPTSISLPLRLPLPLSTPTLCHSTHTRKLTPDWQLTLRAQLESVDSSQAQPRPSAGRRLRL